MLLNVTIKSAPVELAEPVKPLFLSFLPVSTALPLKVARNQLFRFMDAIPLIIKRNTFCMFILRLAKTRYTT